MFYNVQDDRRPLACGDTVTLKGANGSREKYFIDRVAGVGGMSITYIARKEGDGRWVAIKELFPKRLEGLVAKRREDGRIVIFNPLTQTELNDSPAVWNELVGFMERESELSRRAADLYASGEGISQNNADILCILGPFLSTKGNRYLIIDTFEGTSLNDFILRARTNVRAYIEDLLEILAKVCLRLSAFHGLGILHLDLSPANIYLSKINAQTELNPYIIDYASAYDIKNQSEREHFFTCNPFSSPEIKALAEFQSASHGYSCDFSADTYSVAGILFYALTGRYYAPEDAYSTVWRSELDSIFPADVYKSISADTVAFFERALSADPKERFRNAKQMADIFRNLRLRISECGMLRTVEKDDLMGFLLFYKYPLYEYCSENGDLNVLCLGSGEFIKRTVLGLISTGQMLDRRLTVNIVSRDSEECRKELIRSAPLLCEYSDILGDPSRHPTKERIYVRFRFETEQDLLGTEACKRIAEEYKSCRYVLISLGENAKNASLASEYAKCLNKKCEKGSVIHYYMDEDAAKNLRYMQAFESNGARLCPFSIDSYREELDSLGELAFKTHLMYSRAFDPSATREGLIEAFLADKYCQESSAKAALHIKYKLASIGITDEINAENAESAGRIYSSLLEKYEGRLTMLEHRRWMMEKAAEGYRAPKDMAELESYAYKILPTGKFNKGFKVPSLLLHHCLVPCDESGTVISEMKESGNIPRFESYGDVDASAEFDELDKVSIKVHMLARSICRDREYCKNIIAICGYVGACIPKGSAEAQKCFRAAKRAISAMIRSFAEDRGEEERAFAVNKATKKLSALRSILKREGIYIPAVDDLRDRTSVFVDAMAISDYKANDNIIIRRLFDVICG